MPTRTYNDWQYDQKDCTCPLHRYKVAHFCACGRVISHSQADFDTHKFHGGLVNFDSRWYKHGDKPRDTWGRLNVMGLLPYFAEDYGNVWPAFCD